MSKEERHPEYQYLDLLRDILEQGHEKTDFATGTKLKSVFGRQIRFDLSKGFPLLTTKKVFMRGIVHELLWFLKGSTNIKYLVDNDVHIWDDLPYREYKKAMDKGEAPAMTQDEFIGKLKSENSDGDFVKKWGELGYQFMGGNGESGAQPMGELLTSFNGLSGRQRIIQIENMCASALGIRNLFMKCQNPERPWLFPHAM